MKALHRIQFLKLLALSSNFRQFPFPAYAAIDKICVQASQQEISYATITSRNHGDKIDDMPTEIDNVTQYIEVTKATTVEESREVGQKTSYKSSKKTCKTGN